MLCIVFNSHPEMFSLKNDGKLFGFEKLSIKIVFPMGQLRG
jgi:hypothetical protein